MKLPSDVDISPTKIIDAVAAVIAGKGGYTDAQLREYAGFDARSAYFDNCVRWAITLGLARRRTGGALVAVKSTSKEITDGLEDGAKKRIFANALLRWPPFGMFIANIGRGLPVKDCANRVRAHFGLENTSEFMGNFLAGWGLRVGLFRRGVGRNSVILSDEVHRARAEFEASTGPPPDSEAACRLKIESVLGAPAFTYLHGDEVDDFVQALSKYLKDPREAVNKSGAAAEDFLRRAAAELKLPDATRANGLAELAEALYNRKDGSGKHSPAIHDKHRKIAHTIATIRVMGAHGKDKKHLERWALSPETALAQTYLSLGFVRSVHAFIKRGALLEV